MTCSQHNAASEALWQRLAPTVQGSSSIAVRLCSALASGQLAWDQALQMQSLKAQEGGQVNLAAMLHLVREDVTAALECYRSAGCLREALAVSAARLTPCDPEAQLIRQQYVDSLLPPGTLQAYSRPAGLSAPDVMSKAHAAEQVEVAAASLLLLDQPAAAASVLASKGDGCNAASTHAAARVAALAAAHKAGMDREELSTLAAQYALQACLLPSGSLSSSSRGHGSTDSFASPHTLGHGTPILLQSLLTLLQPLAGSCPAVAGTMLVLRTTQHLFVALLQLTKTGKTAAAAAAVSAAVPDVCGDAAVATCSTSASAGTDAVEPGDTGSQYSRGLTARDLQLQQVKSSFQMLLLEALEAYQPQQAPQQQQQQSPQPQQEDAINSHQQQMPGSCLFSPVTEKVLLLAVEECLQNIPPSLVQQLADQGVLLPSKRHDGIAAAHQSQALGSLQQQDQQQQRQLRQVVSPASKSSLALCCAAALWVCLQHIHPGAANTGGVLDEYEVWRQHILPLLVQAEQQLIAIQQSIPPVAVAATAARDSSTLPVLVHQKVPGRRQQYTTLELHALNRPAADAQNCQTTDHLRKRLLEVDVPMVTSPAHVAAIAASIEQLLPGRRGRGHLPSARQGSGGASGQGQQQQHASRSHRRKGQNQWARVSVPPPPPSPPQPSPQSSVQQSALSTSQPSLLPSVQQSAAAVAAVSPAHLDTLAVDTQAAAAAAADAQVVDECVRLP